VRIPDGQHLPFDPFEGKAFRLRIGARPLDPSAWIVLDERTDVELDHKVALLTESPERFAACVSLPQDALSVAAAAELWAMAETHLRTYEPVHLHSARNRIERFESANSNLSPAPALVKAGLLTQEDWCILTQQRAEEAALELAGSGSALPRAPQRGSLPTDRPDREPLLLTAGILCFPNRWRLSEKIGLPMLGIHSPVPQYGEEVGAPTDSLLDRLKPGHPVWRMNWGIADNPTLHQPTGHFDPNAGTRALDIGNDVVLRIERQTLIRLPETRAVVFGIRTIVRTLNEVFSSDPSMASRMATAMETLPEDMRAYKSLTRLGPMVSAWLREQ
jgi:dimethylamine monooxygenase subunit A